ncbi:C-myc promoter-binding protein isoform X6 [Dermacentor albipictus]|uniref:C-myc promoter-binding protein isoform X6 n=1 Tax=Dermacentor albipictus TaxID=60249 RepID=UPI0038FCFB57
MEEKRVADYFVVAGLPANPRPLEEDCVAMQPSGASFGSMPVTDIAVIVRTEGETPPPGFECIEQTPLGFPADLNHGSLRSPSIYLCYRRGRDKPPLVDIGVLYENKQRVMADSEILKKTPYGRPANVNNSGSRTFLTFRRASENAPCNQLVVTDLCIILANKGETPPHAYCKIDRNLNKGMVGSDVYLCYKKSMNRPSLICYEPAVLERFPREDYASFPLPEQVALFCLPMGATVEAWPKKASQPRPTFSTFVLTLGSADKVYGASITFYERFPEEQLTDAQRAQLSSSNRSGQPQPTEEEVFSANKSICLLSHWPFFRTFEKFLRFLYRLSFVKNPRVSVERYISHFMLDIPFPSVQRPRIWIQLEDDHISLSQLEDTPLPLSGASFKEFLKTLAPDNCLCVLLLALTEQKMLFHSLRPDVLTSVSEALVALMFPFHWQCPYIPLCPLGLSDVLSAPLPFIVGVDSRYFDMYEPPQEVACIDLDTNTIFINEEKSFLTLKLLPKKATKTLRGNLQSLYEKVCLYESNVASIAAAAAQNTSAGGALGPIDREIGLHRKERRLELDIQEAFLRFMAAILKDFGSYLRPITTAPKPGVTDPNSLFDINGFLKSRDRTYHRFYQLMMHTQMFTRFIEERSFVSDKDVSLAFFDECTERVDAAGESAEHLLLEVAGSMQSHEHTVFISAPEPPLVEGLNGSPGMFGALNPALFHRQPAMSLLRVVPEFQPSASPVARRTKQEVKSALKAARIQAECPVSWAKCLAGTSYSVWFMHLPAYTKTFASKAKALRVADEVLQRMQQLKLPAPDEVSYRILMLLCGQYGQPALAVKILFDMKKHGVQANAITYGYYNKAVLECAWPTGDSAHWAKLRNVVLAVSQFKRALRRSQGSLGCTVPDAPRSAGSSRTSLEETLRPQLDPMAVTPELLPELLTKTDDRSSSDAVAKPRVHTAAGDQSDAGYGSTSQDETAKASWQELPVVPQPSRERIGGTPGAGSSLLRPMEPAEAVVPTVTGGSTSRVALEVSITSCSQCNTCRSLLYDEEIMDGWTADDSNLNTRCYFCNGTVVPLLTVSIKDYRVEDSPVGGSLAPSMESLPSATGLSSRLSPERSPLAKELSPEATTGRAVTPDTRAGDFHASRPDSIDSGNDGFLLLEESPDAADGPRVGDSCPESPLGSPPGQAGASYLASPTSRALSAPVDIPLAAANESLMVASPSSGSNETSDRAEHRTRRVTVGDAPLGLRTAVGRLGSAELLLDPQSAAGTTPLFKLGSASPSRVSLSLGPSVSLDPMTVPYLSPLVLRKEVENLLEHEGDDCLLSAGFVDHHPILYWNLIWYFKRLSLPSHLPELCLQAVSLLRDRQVPEQWQSVEGKMVVISCCWDNSRLHTNMVPYMYSQLGKNNMSSLVQSLVTEDNKPTKSLRERVLSCVQQSNVREAVELLVRERHKTRNQQRRPSLYRDVLFLSLVALGKDALNQNLFYRDYVKIYEELAAKRSALFKCDKYPSVRAMLCRKYFRDLELKPFSFT